MYRFDWACPKFLRALGYECFIKEPQKSFSQRSKYRREKKSV